MVLGAGEFVSEVAWLDNDDELQQKSCSRVADLEMCRVSTG